MRRGRFLTCLALPVLVLLAGAAGAHDLFLRPKGYLIAPGATVTIPVLNGTFSESENAVARTRLVDLSLITPGGRQNLDRAGWSEQDPQSTVRVTLGGPGTYIVGASLAPRAIELDGATFTQYLEEEGIVAILRQREREKRTGARARERYGKSVKTFLQVEEPLSPRALQPVGHPAEIVPLDHPYALKVGDTLRVRCLVGGRPLAGWQISAGGRRGTSDEPFAVQRVTTDAEGIASIRMTGEGHWYVKFVHMRPVTEADVDYESRWATMTFGLMPRRP